MQISRTTTVRLIVLSVSVLLVYFVAQGLRHTGQADYAELPGWRLADMPLALGDWQGTHMELDEELTRATDADDVSDRSYQNKEGNVVSVHTAAFTGYSFGVQHNPTVCYHGAGWEIAEQLELQFDVGQRKSLSVPLITWRRSGERVMTLYWYQLGDQVLFDRWGLARARLHFLGEQTRPALVKVLMQAPASSSIEAEDDLKLMAENVYRWLNAPHEPSGEEPAAP